MNSNLEIDNSMIDLVVFLGPITGRQGIRLSWTEFGRDKIVMRLETMSKLRSVALKRCFTSVSGKAPLRSFHFCVWRRNGGYIPELRVFAPARSFENGGQISVSTPFCVETPKFFLSLLIETLSMGDDLIALVAPAACLVVLHLLLRPGPVQDVSVVWPAMA